VTLAYGTSTSTQVDDKVTDTATFFSSGPNDPYNTDIYYDRFFGTLVFAPGAGVFLSRPRLAREADARA
jgi:hypothetical protein